MPKTKDAAWPLLREIGFFSRTGNSGFPRADSPKFRLSLGQRESYVFLTGFLLPTP